MRSDSRVLCRCGRIHTLTHREETRGDGRERARGDGRSGRSHQLGWPRLERRDPFGLFHALKSLHGATMCLQGRVVVTCERQRLDLTCQVEGVCVNQLMGEGAGVQRSDKCFVVVCTLVCALGWPRRQPSRWVPRARLDGRFVGIGKGCLVLRGLDVSLVGHYYSKVP